MSQIGTEFSAPPGSGVQTASITLTATQLRALSAAGHGAQLVPAITGKRIFLLGAIAFQGAFTILFANGHNSISSNTDILGGGSGAFWCNLNDVGIVGGNVFDAAVLASPMGSAIDILGEGLFLFPLNYATANADVPVTYTVLFQYL